MISVSVNVRVNVSVMVTMMVRVMVRVNVRVNVSVTVSTPDGMQQFDVLLALCIAQPLHGLCAATEHTFNEAYM